MIYTELFILTCIICFIIDCSGIVEELEDMIKRWLKMPFFHIGKPFSCSLCSTWWVGIIYLLCTGEFTIVNLGYVAMLSFLSSNITNTLYLLQDMVNRLIDAISRLYGE